MSTLQKAINGQRAELTLGGKPIMGVSVLNPTPAFLYLSSLDTVGPEDYLAVIEPWSMATIPLVVPERLYVRDYGRVEPLPNNARAQVTALDKAPALAAESIPHSFTRVLFRDQPANGGALTAQGLGSGYGSGQASEIVLPRTARSKVIALEAAAAMTTVRVEVDGFTVPGLVTFSADMKAARVDLADLGAASVILKVQGAGTVSGLLMVNI